MIDLSRHPFDWLIHCFLCFIPIYFGWARWFVVVFVAVMIEYEQWNYAGKPEIIHYFIYEVLDDFVFDWLGIAGGILCRSI